MKQVFVSYLDNDGQIIDAACRYQDKTYVDWNTDPTNLMSASGLALAEVNGTLRRFYVDSKNFVIQDVHWQDAPIGPKAAKGSRVAATVAVGSTDIYIFFVAEDKRSLASLRFDGSEWSEAMVTAALYNTHRQGNRLTGDVLL